MITYRKAGIDDVESIAQLHSLSWQQNYRGIWTDKFLDSGVLENRRSVWQNRLSQPAANQHVIVAEYNQSICGFACVYVDQDAIWGTLLDNLHVLKSRKGQGIGTHLIKSAAQWAASINPDSGFYLWVLPKNTSARTFYENLGAVNQELVSLESPDGGQSDAYRYVWPSINTLCQ